MLHGNFLWVKAFDFLFNQRSCIKADNTTEFFFDLNGRFWHSDRLGTLMFGFNLWWLLGHLHRLSFSSDRWGLFLALLPALWVRWGTRARRWAAFLIDSMVFLKQTRLFICRVQSLNLTVLDPHDFWESCNHLSDGINLASSLLFKANRMVDNFIHPLRESFWGWSPMYVRFLCLLAKTFLLHRHSSTLFAFCHRHAQLIVFFSFSGILAHRAWCPTHLRLWWLLWNLIFHYFICWSLLKGAR